MSCFGGSDLQPSLQGVTAYYLLGLGEGMMGFLVDGSPMGSILLGGQGLSYIFKFPPEDLGSGAV